MKGRGKGRGKSSLYNNDNPDEGSDDDPALWQTTKIYPLPNGGTLHADERWFLKQDYRVKARTGKRAWDPIFMLTMKAANEEVLEGAKSFINKLIVDRGSWKDGLRVDAWVDWAHPCELPSEPERRQARHQRFDNRMRRLQESLASSTQKGVGSKGSGNDPEGRSKGPCDVFDPWVRWERGQVGI